MASQPEEETEAALLGDCVEQIKSWKGLIEEFLEPEDQQTEISNLKAILKDFVMVNRQVEHAKNAVQEIETFVQAAVDKDAMDVNALYAEKVSKFGEEGVNFETTPIWGQVFNSQNQQESICEVVNEEANENDDETQFEEINDSLMCSSAVFTPPVDPITKKVISDPYKSKACGHIYEYKFILQYIKAMKMKAKCPFIGCNNKNLTASSLVKDTDTQQKIELYYRQNSQ